MAQLALQVIVTGLLVGGVYGLMTVGLTMIYGILKLVNFAHGEFLMLAMYLTWIITTKTGLNPYASIVLVVPVIFCFGLLVQRFVMQPVLNAPHVIQILTTMGLSLVLMNVALIFFKADFRNVPTASKTHSFAVGDLIFSVPHVIAFAVAVVCVLSLWLFLQKTDTGMCMRAVAHDEKAAKLMGINVMRIYMLAYGVGVAIVGVAGVMLAPIYPITPTIGQSFVLICFVCAVLGGLRSVPGAMLGGITVGIIEALTGFFVQTQFQQVGYFIVFIIILIFRPYGFFGKKGM